jgi:hypothetical protein
MLSPDELDAFRAQAAALGYGTNDRPPATAAPGLAREPPRIQEPPGTQELSSP